jgi:glucan phosphoethanolaminetransferase (alkaline phosphatase superfamily)
MKKWKQLVAAFALIAGVGMAMVPAPTASAIDILTPGCKGNTDSTVCKSKKDDTSSLIKIAINTLLYVLGMIAVLMIVVSGVRYITSSGDSSRIKSAKDTLLYAVVGLVVAIMSYAIVNFVLGRF